MHGCSQFCDQFPDAVVIARSLCVQLCVRFHGRSEPRQFKPFAQWQSRGIRVPRSHSIRIRMAQNRVDDPLRYGTAYRKGSGSLPKGMEVYDPAGRVFPFDGGIDQVREQAFPPRNAQEDRPIGIRNGAPNSPQQTAQIIVQRDSALLSGLRRIVPKNDHASAPGRKLQV